MTHLANTSVSLQCPSATSIDSNAQIFGVLTKAQNGDVQVGYLRQPVPATDELLAAAAPAKPTEVFRATVPCAERSCKHFENGKCQLAARIVLKLDPAVGVLPRCAIRSTCRWFRQEGRDACLRCPQVTTEHRNPSALQREVAG